MSQFTDEPLLFPELEEFYKNKETTSKEQKMKEENYKTISEVANDLDIATSVIRYWETKFKKLSPLKRNGRRYFSLEQQKLIEQIKDLLYVQGYTIKAAQNLLQRGAVSKSKESKSHTSLEGKEFVISVIEQLNSIKGILK